MSLEVFDPAKKYYPLYQSHFKTTKSYYYYYYFLNY